MGPWATVLYLGGGVVAFAAFIKALPTVWRFVVACGKAPLIIEAVAKEFGPNGGGLREAVDKQGQRIDDLHTLMDGHLQWHTEQKPRRRTA